MLFMEIFEILGKRRSIEVLLEIYETPGMIQTQIADKTESGSGSKRERLSDLVDLGLVRTESDPNNWSAIKYYLSEEGERVVRLLIAIKDGEDFEPTNYITIHLRSKGVQ